MPARKGVWTRTFTLTQSTCSRHPARARLSTRVLSSTRGRASLSPQVVTMGAPPVDEVQWQASANRLTGGRRDGHDRSSARTEEYSKAVCVWLAWPCWLRAPTAWPWPFADVHRFGYVLLTLLPVTPRGQALLTLLPVTPRGHALLALLPVTPRGHALLALLPCDSIGMCARAQLERVSKAAGVAFLDVSYKIKYEMSATMMEMQNPHRVRRCALLYRSRPLAPRCLHHR